MYIVLRQIKQLAFSLGQPEGDNNQPASQSTAVGASHTAAHQPQFRVEDINVTSLAGLSPHIQISPQVMLHLSHTQPHMHTVHGLHMHVKLL